jgi:hypothetical protein
MKAPNNPIPISSPAADGVTSRPNTIGSSTKPQPPCSVGRATLFQRTEAAGADFDIVMWGKKSAFSP